MKRLLDVMETMRVMQGQGRSTGHLLTLFFILRCKVMRVFSHRIRTFTLHNFSFFRVFASQKIWHLAQRNPSIRPTDVLRPTFSGEQALYSIFKKISELKSRTYLKQLTSLDIFRSRLCRYFLLQHYSCEKAIQLREHSYNTTTHKPSSNLKSWLLAVVQEFEQKQNIKKYLVLPFLFIFNSAGRRGTCLHWLPYKASRRSRSGRRYNKERSLRKKSSPREAAEARICILVYCTRRTDWIGHRWTTADKEKSNKRW